MMAEEEEKVRSFQFKYTKACMDEIIEEANQDIRNAVGDEFDRVENEYQESMKEWQKKCDSIRDNWQEIQKKNKEEYNEKLEQYKKYEKDKNKLNGLNAALSAALAKKDQLNDKLFVLKKSQQLEQINNEIAQISNEMMVLKENTKNSFVEKPEFRENVAVNDYLKENVKKPVRKYSTPVDSLNILLKRLEEHHIPIDVFGSKYVYFGNFKCVVIKEKEGNLLLCMAQKYAYLEYQKEIGQIKKRWDECYLRGYLNGAFLSENFTAKEQSYILTSNITTDGIVTDDKVFILSKEEIPTQFIMEKDAIVRDIEKYGNSFAENPVYPAFWVSKDYLDVDYDKKICTGDIREYPNRIYTEEEIKLKSEIFNILEVGKNGSHGVEYIQSKLKSTYSEEKIASIACMWPSIKPSFAYCYYREN
jgi:hypothetical protein